LEGFSVLSFLPELRKEVDHADDRGRVGANGGLLFDRFDFCFELSFSPSDKSELGVEG